jgi:ribonuclease HI
MSVSLYSDGASRGNPGPSGAGVVLLDEKGEQIFELSR